MSFSKEKFDSIFKNAKCEDLIHPWTKSCFKSNFCILPKLLYGSYRFFADVYLLQLMFYIRTKDKTFLIEHFHNYIKSGYGGFKLAVAFFSLLCVFRNTYKGYRYYMPFCAATVGGILLNFTEKYYRRISNSNLFLYLAFESTINYLEASKIIKRTKITDTLCFMLINGCLMYTMRQTSGIKVDKNSIGLWPFVPPCNKNNENGICKHKGKCSKYCLRVTYSYFVKGLIISLAKYVFSNFNKLKKTPWIFLQDILSTKILSLPFFVGSYTGIYSYVHCYLCKTTKINIPKFSFISGSFAGISFLFFPKISMALAAASAIIHMKIDLAKENKMIPKNLPTSELIFGLSTGVLFHSRIVHPEICPSYIKNAIKTVTCGFCQTVFAALNIVISLTLSLLVVLNSLYYLNKMADVSQEDNTKQQTQNELIIEPNPNPDPTDPSIKSASSKTSNKKRGALTLVPIEETFRSENPDQDPQHLGSGDTQQIWEVSCYETVESETPSVIKILAEQKDESDPLELDMDDAQANELVGEYRVDPVDGRLVKMHTGQGSSNIVFTLSNGNSYMGNGYFQYMQNENSTSVRQEEPQQYQMPTKRKYRKRKNKVQVNTDSDEEYVPKNYKAPKMSTSRSYNLEPLPSSTGHPEPFGPVVLAGPSGFHEGSGTSSGYGSSMPPALDNYDKVEEVLSAAKSLFSKRTRTLYHWMYPGTSKIELKNVVMATWDTLPETEKRFYISQVLGRFGYPASSLMVNPQIGGVASRLPYPVSMQPVRYSDINKQNQDGVLGDCFTGEASNVNDSNSPEQQIPMQEDGEDFIDDPELNQELMQFKKNSVNVRNH